MPRITELQSVTGQETESQDLFLVVDVSAGSSGTKKMTREQVVRALEEEPFNNLQIFSGEFTDPDITLTQSKPTAVLDTDYLPISDSAGTTYRYTLGTLATSFINRFANPQIIFVSARTVTTTRTGSYGSPFLTIADAIAAVIPGSPTIIFLEPGTYTTGQITIPRNTAIVGASCESVRIISNTTGINLFQLSSGSRLQNVSIQGLIQNSLTNPTTGFVSSFLPGETITLAPVLENVVNLSNVYSDVDFAINQDTGNPLFPVGSGLIYADFSILSQASTENTIVSISNLSKSQNAVVFHARNNGRILDTSSILESARIAFLATNGGRIDTTSASISFGDYSFVSQGTRQSIRIGSVSGVLPQSVPTADLIVANKSQIMNAINSYIITNGFSSDSAFLMDYASKWVDTLGYNLRDGSDKWTRAYISTKFSWNGQALIAGNSTLITRLLSVLSNVRQSIASVISITGTIATFFDNLYSVVQTVYNSPSYNQLSSAISAIDISFNFCGSGVSYLSRSSIKKSIPASLTIKRETGGVIDFTGRDQEGNQFFRGYTIEGKSGRITGRKLSSSIKQASRRIANSRIIL